MLLQIQHSSKTVTNMQANLNSHELMTGTRLYTRGTNEYGQLGNGERTSVKHTDWFEVKNIFTSPIKHVSCGYYHVIVLTGILKRQTT
jgi:alpha-tubulin suppressor-like RCC1 family protein